jgi:hypothetical protein
VPRGAEGDLQGRGVVVGDLVGDGDELLRRRHDVLGEPARAGDAEEDLPAEQVRHDAVADGELLDALPEEVDAAHDLEPLDEGERDREARRPLADVDVDVVQRTCFDGDADVTRRRLGVLDVLDGEHPRPPELADDCGLHDESSSSLSRLDPMPDIRPVKTPANPMRRVMGLGGFDLARCRTYKRSSAPAHARRAIDVADHDAEAER